jgi:hypothetical protein
MNHHGYATSARELGAAAYIPKPDIAAAGENGLTSRLGLQKRSLPEWTETAQRIDERCGTTPPARLMGLGRHGRSVATTIWAKPRATASPARSAPG